MNKSFLWLKNLFSGTKQKVAAQIEDAERVVIDSSALHCPICLLIFSSTPVILPCGHSFCQTCIRRLITISFQQHANIYSPTYECALCRSVCCSDARLTKNYVVDALLQSVYEIALEESAITNNNIKFSLERSIVELNECRSKICELERIVEEERSRLHMHFQVNILLVILFIVAFFYCLKGFLKTN